MSGFDFSPINFAAGVGVGWGTAFAAYQARNRIARMRRIVAGQEGQDSALRGSNSGYLGELIKFCESNHLAGQTAKLSDILIEPRFIPTAPLAIPPEDDVLRNVFHVVPILPDMPYLHAPYNVETLSIEELDNGDRAIAILGEPGSGRTTALNAIALWVLGKVKFTPPHDRVQERLEQEEEGMAGEERAKVIKERLQIQEMALRSLASKRGEDVDAADDVSIGKASGTRLSQLNPIYIHLGDILVGTGEYGREVDPAEPIIRAAQHYVGGITAKTMVRSLYQRFEDGDALVLLDGFDEINPAERGAKLAWLRALLANYPRIMVIITGSAAGYGPLVKVGFAPVFLRPWNDVNSRRLTTNWAAAWPQISGKRRTQPPDEKIVAIAQQDTRARSPFELTLKTWALYEDPEQTDYEDWMRRMIGRLLGDQTLEELTPRLIELASLQLDEGYITVTRLEERALGVLRSQRAAARSAAPVDEAEAEDADELDDIDADINALFDDDNDRDDEISALEPDDDPDAPVTVDDVGEIVESEEDIEPDSTLGKEYVRLLRSLEKSGLLFKRRGGRYQFLYQLIVDYLGSLGLAEMSAEEHEAKVIMPRWNGAFTHAALHTPLDEVVALRLEAPSDVLQNNVLEMARWLAYVPGPVEWRSSILSRLGNMFVAANQYKLVRERVAAALIGARDKQAARVFRKALRHPIADVRRLACLGIGALQAEEVIPEIIPLMERDPDGDVILAAGLSLGAIGTNEALERMADAFLSNNERLQQAVAEAFAAIPEEGYPVLYDAINHEDISLRRAAVFGIRRINTPWALIALYRTSLEDDQWYVRSAAEIAFSQMSFGDSASGPRRYPSVENINWLREWVMSLGDVAQQTTTPDEFLRKAVSEGDSEVQALAVENIGQLGIVTDIDILYMALRHRESVVREASHRALANIQLQMGQPLPSPA